MDGLATHGLSCRQSQRRHYRYAVVNDIVHRALSSAKIPSCLEPSNLQRSDGKSPDGVTIVPWRSDKLLVWDATCPDMFASYTMSATSETGAVAALAEDRKRAKYLCLEPTYSFTPVAIESAGAFGPVTVAFMWDLGKRFKPGHW